MNALDTVRIGNLKRDSLIASKESIESNLNTLQEDLELTNGSLSIATQKADAAYALAETASSAANEAK